jgi:hypothetical protein
VSTHVVVVSGTPTWIGSAPAHAVVGPSGAVMLLSLVRASLVRASSASPVLEAGASQIR